MIKNGNINKEDEGSNREANKRNDANMESYEERSQGINMNVTNDHTNDKKNKQRKRRERKWKKH